MLSESRLSNILNLATHSQRTSKTPNVSLVPFLCNAIVKELEFVDFQVWHVEPEQSQVLWRVGKGDDPFTISHDSLRNLTPGVVERFHSPTLQGHDSTSISLTLATVVDAASLVAACVHSSRQNVEDALLQLVEILADVRRRELLQRLFESNRSQSRIFQLIDQFQSATTPQELLQILATEGALISNVDRIVIGERQSRTSWKLMTSSATETIENRSEEVQQLCSLITAASQSPVESNSQIVLPLSVSGEWDDARYAAVFEQQADSKADWQFARRIAAQAATCLAVLEDHRFRRRRSRSVRRSRWLSFTVITILAGLVAASLFVPVEMKIRVYGQSMPQIRQEIFAPENGVIQAVFVDHGQTVEPGTVLCEIYSDDLFVSRERTRELLATSEARLEAIRTISRASSSSQLQSNGSLPLSVEQKELEKKVESLHRQFELIESQIATLKVVAPFHGQVFHERIQEELLGRPVQQGQFLMQIASTDGPWELRLRIPESEVRHVIDAQSKSSEVALTYALETSPEVERSSTLKTLARTTDLDATGQLSVLATSSVDTESLSDLRFGAGVIGQIECGKRSLFYLFTRRLLDFWAKYSPL